MVEPSRWSGGPSARGRGAPVEPRGVITREAGPSPPARGAAALGHSEVGGDGSIPIRTGSSRPPPKCSRGRWVHPRTYGEQDATTKQ